MEEIKFGDYIRTNYKIRRVTNSNFYMQQYVECGEDLVWKNDIVKHSKNITDLIEVGDYVNGSKLISIDYAEDKEGNCDKLHYYYQFEDDEKDINEYYETLKIKSIVTKEQFANMEYRLEE